VCVHQLIFQVWKCIFANNNIKVFMKNAKSLKIMKTYLINISKYKSDYHIVTSVQDRSSFSKKIKFSL
jgi:hypothetical protein